MSFRHDMRGKSPQQQEIVRKRDEEDKRRTEAYERKKKEAAENEIKCELSPRLGDYEGIFVKNKEKYLLELRVSGTALLNEPCGLKNVNITEWLCQTAKTFINEVKEYEVLMITSNDVQDKKLVTSWKELKREENPFTDKEQ